jgi:hypothetical protein
MGEDDREKNETEVDSSFFMLAINFLGYNKHQKLIEPSALLNHLGPILQRLVHT